jgi:hypothetical protein
LFLPGFATIRGALLTRDLLDNIHFPHESRIWTEWRASLLIVKPDTVKGFRLFWTRLSRRNIGGLHHRYERRAA